MSTPRSHGDAQMTLMRVRRMAQLTLPAEVRRALNVQEGDFLEATIVKEGVLLKPVAMVERERAWQRIADLKSRVRDLRPDPSKSDTEAEEEIAEMVKEFRRTKKKHG
jgi:AbrB family looped-hinge helix DNA binding protein